MRLAIFIAAVFGCSVTWSQETNDAGLGKSLVLHLASAPFPHSSRAQGYTYKGQNYSAAEHYSDNTVAVFIPRGFRETGRVDFVIHFHGWKNSVSNVLKRYRLIDQLVASGRNAVLVVPQGPKNAPDSSGGKLADANGFRRFMDDVTALLRQGGALRQTNFSVGQIVLSGHSGGYKVIASILDRGGLTEPVREVWLFDALYADTDKFMAWMDRTPAGRLANIYTDGGGTKRETEALIAALKQQSTPFFAGEEADLKAGDLRRRGFIFLHTALAHNDVVETHETFKTFLESSGLEALK